MAATATEPKQPSFASEPRKTAPKVKVTDFVLWFPNTGEDVRPQPMLVEEVFPTGMIAGNIFSRGRLDFKATVQHRSSQIVKDNPRLAIRDGVYLTVDEYYATTEKAPFDK